MSFFICLIPVCPVRAEASHRSEQVSQLIFGETCELLETDTDFIRIRMHYDNYEGWCQRSQLEEIGDIEVSEQMLAGEWVNKITIDDQVMHIPFGSSIGFVQHKNGIAATRKIIYHGLSLRPNSGTFRASQIRELTFTFLNTPYLWGGRSVFGIDCSGFSQLVFQRFNIRLLRDAYQQAMQGEEVESLEQAKCGDLAFFDNEAGRITHVGILLSSNTIIHASGKVRIDHIDNLGIINSENKRRSHKLKLIKRVIDKMTTAF